MVKSIINRGMTPITVIKPKVNNESVWIIHLINTNTLAIGLEYGSLEFWYYHKGQ